MKEEESIQFVLSNCYQNIGELLGELVKLRLKIPNYENEALTSRLLKVAQKLPASPIYQEINFYENQYYEKYDENEDISLEDFKDDFLVKEDYESELFKLDSSLYLLDKTLAYGKQYCEGFNHIFQNINMTKPQEADTRIAEVLAQVKAFEFLSKLGFRNITKVDQWQNKLNVDFMARKSPNYFAVMVTRLYSAKHIEENFSEYDESSLVRSLTTDISYAINQIYPQIEKYCTTHVGVGKGIIIISSSRDFFGNKKFENTIYGLKTNNAHSILNKEWTMRKEGQNKYKYFNHIVIITGRNIWNAIVYPSINIKGA